MMPQPPPHLPGFATGQVKFMDRYRDDLNTRIVIPVTVAQTNRITAIVDTGAPFCILDPEEADSFELPSPIRDFTLHVRRTSYTGKLYPLSLTFIPPSQEDGISETLEATFFIPILQPGERWMHPNFIGLDGCLLRMRFAVDPEENFFYYGVLGLQ